MWKTCGPRLGQDWEMRAVHRGGPSRVWRSYGTYGIVCYGTVKGELGRTPPVGGLGLAPHSSGTHHFLD